MAPEKVFLAPISLYWLSSQKIYLSLISLQPCMVTEPLLEFFCFFVFCILDVNIVGFYSSKTHMIVQHSIKYCIISLLTLYRNLCLLLLQVCHCFDTGWTPVFFLTAHLHVISYIDWIQLISQESVPQMHPLFLPSWIDWNDPWIDHDDDPYDEVMFL